jgi:3-dehydroquinate synthase
MSDAGTSIFVGSIQGLLEALPSASRRVFLCDSNTEKYCFTRLGIQEEVVVIPSGEASKSMVTVQHVMKQLLDLEISRYDYLICLGGGVVTDLGGFVGTIFKRGIQVINIPTSLLGMVDAAVGGKNGVDFHSVKNAVGSFRWVNSIILPEFLDSLPWIEVQNGFMEMMKHGLIASRKHFEDCVILWNQKALPSKDLIKESINIKTDHCLQDFRDSGLRNRLNFGHTVGHAIEGLALEKGIALSHGKAVGLGMMVEAQLSVIKTGLSSEECSRIQMTLESLARETDFKPFEASEVLRFARSDKKNHQRNVLNFVGLKTVGEAVHGQLCTETEFTEALKVIGIYD